MIRIIRSVLMFPTVRDISLQFERPLVNSDEYLLVTLLSNIRYNHRLRGDQNKGLTTEKENETFNIDQRYHFNIHQD